MVEQPNRVVLLEVLPLHQGIGVHRLDRADEGLDESDVCVTSQAALRVALVEGVVQQVLVVRPAVERDRQSEPRVEAGSGYVKCELADRNAHAARSLVAQAQDALVVGDNDETDSALTGVAEHLWDVVYVVRGDPHSPGPAHDMAVLPTRTPNRRRVDDRGKLFEVIDQQPVEERLVPILQRRETDVLLELVTLSAEMLELEGDLLFDRHGSPRQEAAKSQRRSLGLGESSVLVDCRAVEQLPTPRRHSFNRQVSSLGPTSAQHFVLPSLSRVQVTRFSLGPEGPNVTFA